MLSAAIDAPEKALGSFVAWQSQVKLDEIDGADMRLVPLVYKNIGRNIPDRGVAGRIRGISRYTWIRNSYRIDLCARLLGRLNDKGVPSILIKGSALMTGVTEDLSTRQMGDCDLLVASKDRRVAFEALAAEGMRSVPVDWTYMSGPEVESFHGLTFEFPGELPDVVDLHWRPLREVSNPDLTVEFFKQARPILVHRQQTLVPCTEHMLLQCLVHGSGTDSRQSYDWLADAFLIYRSVKNVDWDLFAATARNFCLGAIARNALEIFSEETGIRPPQRAWDSLKTIRATFSDRLEIALRGKKDNGFSIIGRVVHLLQAVRRARAQDAELSFAHSIGKMWCLVTTGSSSESGITRRSQKETAWFPSGWHDREPTGRWTASRFATGCLSADSQKGFGEVLSIAAQTPGRSGWQFVAIASNRKILCLKLLRSGNVKTIKARLPESLWCKNILPLQFYVLRMWKPSRLENSSDHRWLGVFILDIQTELAELR